MVPAWGSEVRLPPQNLTSDSDVTSGAGSIDEELGRLAPEALPSALPSYGPPRRTPRFRVTCAPCRWSPCRVTRSIVPSWLVSMCLKELGPERSPAASDSPPAPHAHDW